jgi:hypothetical protein
VILITLNGDPRSRLRTQLYPTRPGARHAVCTDDYHKYDRDERKRLDIAPLHPDCNYLDILALHLERSHYRQSMLKPVYDHSTGSLVRPEYVEPRDARMARRSRPLELGRDSGRPVDFLYVNGNVTRDHATKLEKTIWQHLPDLRPLRADQFGDYNDHSEIRHSDPLALTQLLLTYHLLRAYRGDSPMPYASIPTFQTRDQVPYRFRNGASNHQAITSPPPARLALW